MVQFNEIPVDKIVLLLGISVLILAIQRFIKRYVIRWVKNEQTQKFIREYVPLIINIAWIVFFIYTIYVLTFINPIISIFVIGLVIILSWNNLKDFVEGTIFRFQKGNLVDQTIKVGDISGVIVKMGITKMDVQLDNGEILLYPYSKLSTQIISTTTNAKHFKNFTISIPVPFTSETEKLKKQVLIKLLNIPWVVSTLNIKVELVAQDSEKINIKINAHTLDEKFIPKIKQALIMTL